MVRSILELVQLQAGNKAVPVNDQHREAPELPRAVDGAVDGVHQQAAGGALHELKRPGDGILAAGFGQNGVFAALCVVDQIQPHGSFVAFQRVDLLNHAVRGQLNALDDAVVIQHIAAEVVIIGIADVGAGLDNIFQQIRPREIAVELRLNAADGRLGGVGGGELLFIFIMLDPQMDNAVQRQKDDKAQQHRQHTSLFEGAFILHRWFLCAAIRRNFCCNYIALLYTLTRAVVNSYRTRCAARPGSRGRAFAAFKSGCRCSGQLRAG